MNRRNEYFKDKCCVNCGSLENLQLDHIDPDSKHPSIKGKGTARIFSWSEARRTEELSKCQVLCIDCHKLKTKDWHKSRRQHGSTGYWYGCRCEVCYKAKQALNKKRYG